VLTVKAGVLPLEIESGSGWAASSIPQK